MEEAYSRTRVGVSKCMRRVGREKREVRREESFDRRSPHSLETLWDTKDPEATEESSHGCPGWRHSFQKLNYRQILCLGSGCSLVPEQRSTDGMCGNTFASLWEQTSYLLRIGWLVLPWKMQLVHTDGMRKGLASSIHYNSEILILKSWK